jgi:hypothetical protein
MLYPENTEDNLKLKLEAEVAQRQIPERTAQIVGISRLSFHTIPKNFK